MKLFVAIGVALAISACGSEKDSDSAKTTGEVQKVSKSASSEIKSEVPKMVITRVALDENGEPVGEPETRAVYGESSADSSETTLVSSFEGAKAFDAKSDEVDSSTSQCGWRCRRGWYYRPYYGGYRNCGYNYYMPTYASTYYMSYSYSSYSSFNNYGYYSYTPAWGW